MMDRTYGPGFNQFVTDEQADEVPSVSGTIDYLFPQVWARPHLTLRDRRLLVLGVTTMLGRQDLLETQLRGAVTNGELTAPSCASSPTSSIPTPAGATAPTCSSSPRSWWPS